MLIDNLNNLNKLLLKFKKIIKLAEIILYNKLIKIM